MITVCVYNIVWPFGGKDTEYGLPQSVVIENLFHNVIRADMIVGFLDNRYGWEPITYSFVVVNEIVDAKYKHSTFTY